MKEVRGISVVGLGKLGLCIAASFADKGYQVFGVDVDSEKVKKINQGISPIEETGLAALLKQAKKNLSASGDSEAAVLKSDVTFIVVATPSLADGSFSNAHLEHALENIGAALRKKKEYHLAVITSTVMPKTSEKVAKFILEKTSGKKFGRDFGLAYNPEFIALGSVIRDFLNPDFILIGESRKKDGDILEAIYRRTCENSPRFARMSLLNAEITKITLNCYVTTKITFANSLAALCESLAGADANVVTQAIGLDSRIGAKYLRPGLGFGGPCFPRDNVAFAAFARSLETQAKLAEMVDEVNRDQVSRVVNRIKGILAAKNISKKAARIGFLGLSYKPNTPVIDDSQALNIAQMLVNEGFQLNVYDPLALAHARSVLGDAVVYAKSADACLADADLGVIATPYEEFKQVNFKKLGKNIVILDCWRLLGDPRGINIQHLGVGPRIN